ncbi:KOW motif domain protein [Pyrenophora tritici-repentis]|nr:KOW motif domain protein [Pyrenophora tritici-repentis]
MSQLVARPGRNAARQAKKLKEIQKVKHAIQWHERERKKRQELKQAHWDSKQAVLQRIAWEHQHIKGARKRALAAVKEDWKLGPLRPNRAIGPNADKYGALTPEYIQKPEIPLKTQKNRNEVKEKKGLPLEYPLVVDEKRYFPIVKDDRVVILKGKDAGKIGKVKSIVERTHEIIVDGLNKQFFDSSVFGASAGLLGPRQENEVPLPLDDVRLVIPGELVRDGVRQYQDVIVERIHMERHTRGIDPYTGTMYIDEPIPEDHQYDPETGLPIFHRYIAGTKQRIEWPWEHEQVEDTESAKNPANKGKKSLPWTSLARWRSKNKEDGASEEATNSVQQNASTVAERLSRIEQEQQKKYLAETPTSDDTEKPQSWDGDTNRNVVEGVQNMSYTLVAPPFPDTLADELRTHIHDFSIQARKDAKKGPNAPRKIKLNRTSEKDVLAREAVQMRQRAAEKMKTPMQLRWELEQRKKAEAGPLVDEESLLNALGKHMLDAKKKPYRGKKTFSAETEELD